MCRSVTIVLLALAACSADNSSKPAPKVAEAKVVETKVAEAKVVETEVVEAPKAGPQLHGLERFRRTGDDRGCPAQAKGDCASALELAADGTIVLDPWGAPGVAPLTARLTDAELERVAATLTAAELVALLEQKKVCGEANPTETMLVRVGGTERRGETGYCNQGPIQAVRKELLELTRTHFPEHHLISPPF